MEKVKAVWAKVVAAFDWAASWVAQYPKISLGVILGLAVAMIF